MIRDRPDRDEEEGNLQGESDGSSSIPFQDSSWYDGEARNDFWSISGNFVYRHHVEPRVKLYVPKEESFGWRSSQKISKDAEVPALAHTSHGSDSERHVKVASMMHCIYTHFPKDRNCFFCMRTKKVLLAEDALAKLHFVQKSLVT